MGSDESGEFDDWADHYDESVRSRDDFPFRGYDRALKRVVTDAAVTPPCRVLDLGIGTGNLSRMFLDLGCQVWGIDFSRNMLSVAKEKVPAARLAQADILGPWPEAVPRRFDRIVSAYVFHHFAQAKKVDLLARLTRDHCADGGRVIIADICFPTRDALREARIRWKDVWDEEHYWVVEEIVPACRRAGLRVSHRQISDFAGIFVFDADPSPRSGA